MLKKLLCSLILLTLLVSTVSAYTIVVRPLDTSGNEQAKKVIDYRFEFSNDSSCSNVIFSHEETIETSESGIAVIQIDTSNITQVPKYICEYKNLVLRTVHNVSDQFFDTMYISTINASDNITASYFKGDGSQLTGLAGGDITSVTTLGEYLTGGADSGIVSLLLNETKLNNTILSISLNPTGNLTVVGNISADLGDFDRLTVTGTTILQGLTLSENIIPLTTNLYTLGNSTHWFKELWSKSIYGEFINTTTLNATDINTENIDTTNMTLGGYEMYKAGDGSLNIDLG